MQLRSSIATVVALAAIALPAAAFDIITTVAGNGANTNFADGVPATSATIADSDEGGNSVVAAPSGELYFCDAGGNRVRKVDAAGNVITVAGTGIIGYTGDGGPATAAQLAHPFGVAVDDAANIYIADRFNHCIRKVAADGTIATIAGSGTAGFSGDGGQATAAILASPLGVFWRAGKLYIVDGGNGRVRAVDLATGIIATVAGGGSAPGPDFGDAGPATSASLLPQGIFVTAGGELYIADQSSNRVRKVDAGGTIHNMAGSTSQPPGYSGDAGPATAAQLRQPVGVAVDAGGNLFITDSENQRLRKVNAADGIITTVAGNGSIGFAGDGGPAANALLAWPSGLAVDSNDNLYIADETNGRIRAIDKATGNIATKVGVGWGAYGGDGGAATAASLGLCLGLTSDGAGNVYVADMANHRVRKIDANGQISTVAGTGSAGFAGDGGPAVSAALWFPSDVCLDGSGNLYIVDSENQRVRKVAAATGIITTVAGGGTYTGPGEPPPMYGDGGPAVNAVLSNPEAAVVDGAGNLYIATGPVVRKVDPAGTISTFAGNPQPNAPLGDGGPANQAALRHALGLALDGAGSLYITEKVGRRIRKVATDGIITTVAGTGARGFSGDGGPAINATVNEPTDVALDAAGNLYIADAGNVRIRKVAADGIIATIAGTGVWGVSGDGVDALTAQLGYPGGLAFGAKGLYLSDTGANKVRLIRHNNPPVVEDVAMSQNPVKINTDITFTATATDADGDPLSYVWSVPGLPSVAGNPATMQFPTAGTFIGTLVVSDPYESTTSTGNVEVVAPASGGAGVTNVSQGDPPVENPLNGITIAVLSSDGGVVELNVNVDEMRAGTHTASTDFSDVAGRGSSGVLGPRPVHQFVETGVFVATSSAIDNVTSEVKGKARKTLSISRKETGQEARVTGEPSSRDIIPKKIKGKFVFINPKATPVADTVSFSGTIALPPGLDLANAQEVALGIGNITDTTLVDPKGKGVVPGTAGRIKKLRIKYPRLKGTTITTGTETATVDITLSMPDMSPAGFDTEGVKGDATDLDAKGAAPRNIQIAVVLAGVSYELLAPASFKVAPKKNVGQLLPARTSP
jgi:sugar lactone lactonase YvrE